MYKWKPSKQAAHEYVQTMENIKKFCEENRIEHSLSFDSFYFAINGKNYRVSNHTIASSNAGAYRFNERTGIDEQIREQYHDVYEDIICYTASKTRLPEIYQAILGGKKLNKRGQEMK